MYFTGSRSLGPEHCGGSLGKGGRKPKLCLEEEIINPKSGLTKGGVSSACGGFSMFFSPLSIFYCIPFFSLFVYSFQSFPSPLTFFFFHWFFLLAAFPRAD